MFDKKTVEGIPHSFIEENQVKKLTYFVSGFNEYKKTFRKHHGNFNIYMMFSTNRI